MNQEVDRADGAGASGGNDSLVKSQVLIREGDHHESEASTAGNQGDKSAPSVDGWPTSPQKLHRVEVGGLLLDLLYILMTVPFLVLISMVINRDGSSVDEDDWGRIQKGMSVGATLFPVIFAAVIGRMNRQFAAWKLERGISVRTLEQLFGSSTLFNTLSTQTLLRAVNPLAFLLIVLWCISPIGSQSLLRMLHTRPTLESTPIEISHLNNSHISTDGYRPSDKNSLADAMYDYSLLSSSAVKQSPLDVLGALKIPYIKPEDLASNNSDWIDVETEIPSYSSLAGIQIDGIENRRGETRFIMETSYFNLALYNIQGEPTFNGNGILYENSTDCQNTDKSGDRGGHHWLTNITFNFAVPDTDFRASFNVTQIFVDVAVKCVDSVANCAATAIRPTSRVNPAASGRFWASCRTIIRIFNSLETKGEAPSLTEAYFRNPDTPLAANIYTHSTFTLPVDTFILRLTQVFNTYALLLTHSTSPSSSDMQNSTGTFVDPTLRPTYVVSWPWLAISLVATLVIIIGGFTPGVLNLLTLNPDILGYVSTLTRDASSFDAPSGGSTLSGTERALLLKDRVIRLGDVAIEDAAVGRLGMSSLEGTFPSIKGRYYE